MQIFWKFSFDLNALGTIQNLDSKYKLDLERIAESDSDLDPNLESPPFCNDSLSDFRRIFGKYSSFWIFEIQIHSEWITHRPDEQLRLEIFE